MMPPHSWGCSMATQADIVIELSGRNSKMSEWFSDSRHSTPRPLNRIDWPSGSLAILGLALNRPSGPSRAFNFWPFRFFVLMTQWATGSGPSCDMAVLPTNSKPQIQNSDLKYVLEIMSMHLRFHWLPWSNFRSSESDGDSRAWPNHHSQFSQQKLDWKQMKQTIWVREHLKGASDQANKRTWIIEVPSCSVRIQLGSECWT